MNDNQANKVSTGIQPYLFFGGRCQEALDFYRDRAGAQIGMVMHFDESPDPVPKGMLQPGFEHKVMHSEFRLGGSTILASDGLTEKESVFKGFSLALLVPTEAEADRLFDALADGGHVQMALGKTFWSPRYGMLTDRFGVAWMVMVPGPAPK
jgi:PhnB protein